MLSVETNGSETYLHGLVDDAHWVARLVGLHRIAPGTGVMLHAPEDAVMRFGGDDEDRASSANLNIYLLVTNVFNTENIIDVYRYTGSPDNDGYLAVLTDQSQIDPQAFRDLYAVKVNNPFHFGAPRTIRLGVRFDF